jgi:hypothetical protein
VARRGLAGQGEARRGEARRGKVFFHKGTPMKFSDKLQPGDIITRAEIEQATGREERKDPAGFALMMLRLRAELIAHLKRIHGRELTVRILADGMTILNDRESAAYNPKRFRDGLRLARRAHRRLMAVDAGKLTPEEREAHTRAVCKQAAALSALRVKSEIPVATQTRPESPKLMAGK